MNWGGGKWLSVYLFKSNLSLRKFQFLEKTKPLQNHIVAAGKSVKSGPFLGNPSLQRMCRSFDREITTLSQFYMLELIIYKSGATYPLCIHVMMWLL